MFSYKPYHAAEIHCNTIPQTINSKFNEMNMKNCRFYSIEYIEHIHIVFKTVI